MNCIISGMGRAGKELIRLIAESEGIQLVGGVCHPGSDKSGNDLGLIAGIAPLGVYAFESTQLDVKLKELKPDVVIDFSHPDAAVENIPVCTKQGIAVVIGTTGFRKDQLDQLKKLTYKYKAPILYAPNITMGVNVMMEISKLVAEYLQEYDFQITEIHHKNKKDAPSGTAFKIANAVNEGLQASGHKPIQIPINSSRVGGYIGMHELMVVGEYDKIVITHESFSRKVFAQGALRAAIYVSGKRGWHEMSDVMGFQHERENVVSM